MKKIISIALALCMVLALCACGTSQTAPASSGTVSEKPAVAEPVNEPAEEPAEQPAEQVEEVEEEIEEETFTPGQAAGAVYENTYFNLRCEFPEGWTIAGEEELLQLSGIASDILSYNQKYSEALDSGAMVYDLYASYDAAYASVNITMQKLSAPQVLPAAAEDSIAESSLKDVEDVLEASGITPLECYRVRETVAGSEHAVIYTTATYEGIDVFMKQVIIVKGQYAICITAAAYVTDTSGETIDMFTAID